MCRSDGISYMLDHHRDQVLGLVLPGELEDGPLGVGSAGADVHVLGVLNRGDGTGSEQDLLPGLLQVDDVDTIGLLLEDVLLHRGLAVVRPDVGGGSQHLGNVILLGIEAGVRITKEGKQGTYHMLQDASSDYKLASNVDQTAFPILDHHY